MTFTRREFSLQFVTCLGLALLIVVSIWAYWPGRTGGFLLDDNSSLVKLQRLQESPEQILDYISGERSGPIGRQISMATFSLEQVYTDASITTIKRNNILLHQINGLLVFWLAYLLFAWRHVESAGLLALLSAAIWILAPLQVSTVLYAVQRMAMLSTSFVLLALISYLKWRFKPIPWTNGIHWLAAAALFATLAPFAKENGLLAVPIILLLEVVLLQGKSNSGASLRGLLIAAKILLFLCLVIAVIGVIVRWDGLNVGYATRSFTLLERLLTQPVVLWDYVLQFYLPDIRRMGLYHDDFPVFSTLVDPPIAIYSIISWSAVIAASAVLYIKGRALPLVYCAGFFLIAHSIESSFLALEIYFEHRNYLPSIALALLPSALLSMLLPLYRTVLMPLLAWGSIYVIYLLVQSAILGEVWSSDTLLMTHHHVAHPNSSRANSAMASRMAELGDFGAARNYSKVAFHLAEQQKSARAQRVGDYHLGNIALACLAQHPMPKEDLSLLGLQHPERPLGDSNLLNIISRLVTERRCPAMQWDILGDRFASMYLETPRQDRASHAVYTALASFSNGLQRYDLAIRYTSLALMLKPANPQSLLMHLHFSAAIEDDSEYDMAMSKLLRLCQSNSLNLEQRRTVALYRGGETCEFQ
jgi:hypothetical protein